MNKYYVYIHRKLTDGLPFYVGKGSGNRATNFSCKGRSEYWLRTANKYGVVVEIYKDNLTEEDAYKIEKVLIQRIEHFGIILCNLAEGGVGPVGVVRSLETRKRISDVQMGKKLTEETKQKMRNSQAKIKDLKSVLSKEQWTEEERQKARDRMLGNTLSEVTKQKISETSKNRWADPEYRKRISDAQKERWKKRKESKSNS